MRDANMAEPRPKIKLEDWHKLASKKFGKNARHWKFICPVCETPQTAQDFIDAGAPEEEAKTSIAVECIGRWLPEKQKAFDSRQGKIVKGQPCDYAGYGLFALNPVPVEFEDGKIFHAFDFHEVNIEAPKLS